MPKQAKYDIAIKSLTEEGWTDKQIADYLGMKAEGIREARQRIGIGKKRNFEKINHNKVYKYVSNLIFMEYKTKTFRLLEYIASREDNQVCDLLESEFGEDKDYIRAAELLVQDHFLEKEGKCYKISNTRKKLFNNLREIFNKLTYREMISLSSTFLYYPRLMELLLSDGPLKDRRSK